MADTLGCSHVVDNQDTIPEKFRGELQGEGKKQSFISPRGWFYGWQGKEKHKRWRNSGFAFHLQNRRRHTQICPLHIYIYVVNILHTSLPSCRGRRASSVLFLTATEGGAILFNIAWTLHRLLGNNGPKERDEERKK